MSDKKVIYSLLIMILGAVIYASLLDKETLSQDQAPYSEKQQVHVEINDTPSSIEANTPLNTQTETLSEPTQIDHYSVNAVLNFYKQQALKLLEEYKYHEANAENSAESQFALYLMRLGCLFQPRIETQADLDSFLLEINTSPDLIDESVYSLMSDIGRCDQLSRYIGHDVDRFILVKDSLKPAVDIGHHIAKLIHGLMKKFTSMSPTDIEGLFNDAYLYAKDYPQHKAEVYGAVGVYLSGIEGRNFDVIAVGLLGHRERLIHQENMSPEVIDKLFLSEMETQLLSYDIDEILSKADQFSKAFENGDWSFLGLN